MSYVCRNLFFLTLATSKQDCTVCRTFAFLASDTLPSTHTVVSVLFYLFVHCCFFMDATVHVHVHAQLSYSRKLLWEKTSTNMENKIFVEKTFVDCSLDQVNWYMVHWIIVQPVIKNITMESTITHVHLICFCFMLSNTTGELLWTPPRQLQNM